MPLDSLPEAFLQTIVYQIACLLLEGAAGDMEAARHAAATLIGAYAPRTDTELRLAARAIAFNLQAGEALAQAADPQMPLTRVIRLRSGAVSLSREAEKAERRLEKLRQERLEDQPEAPAEDSPRAEKTTALIDDNRKVAAYAQAHGLSWTEALRQRRREQRRAERRAREAVPAEDIAVPAFA